MSVTTTAAANASVAASAVTGLADVATSGDFADLSGDIDADAIACDSLVSAGDVTIATAGKLNFGQNNAYLDELATGDILDDATFSIPVNGHMFIIWLNEHPNGVGAQLLVQPSAGVPVTINFSTGSIFTTVQGTDNKVNLYYSGGNLIIENKLGSTESFFYSIMRVRD